jgi:hypothetical protein
VAGAFIGVRIPKRKSGIQVDPIGGEMAPIQKLFALTGIALALAVVAPQSMEAEETKTLTVTKDCNTAAALAPGELGYCIIIESNFRPLRLETQRSVTSAQGFLQQIIPSSIAG